MVLGVTGGIAAGKSAVTEVFRRLGAAVVSADEIAREVVRPGSPVLDELVQIFGPGILCGDGTLDRTAMASRVFADPEARRNLNRIIHPAIAALAGERLRALAAKVPLVLYEAPLLYEVGAEERVDAVLVVRVDQKLQLQRLMARDGLTETEARSRVAAQMPQEEKVARADFVIDNSGPPEKTTAQVRNLFKRLSALSPPDSPESR